MRILQCNRYKQLFSIIIFVFGRDTISRNIVSPFLGLVGYIITKGLFEYRLILKIKIKSVIKIFFIIKRSSIKLFPSLSIQVHIL